MIADANNLCAAYDQLSDRTCRYYVDHGGRHNFARLEHDSALERELRRDLDELVRDTLGELDGLRKDVDTLQKAHTEGQRSLEEAVRIVDSEWRTRLAAALDLFDTSWCTEHGHAPKPEVFERVAELRKLASAGAIDRPSCAPEVQPPMESGIALDPFETGGYKAYREP